MLERCREDKDEALKVMLQASKDLDEGRRAEEELSELISDDHVEAARVRRRMFPYPSSSFSSLTLACSAVSQRGISMQELFPIVKPGMVIVKINHVDTEDLEFDEIMKQAGKAAQPHAIEFK